MLRRAAGQLMVAVCAPGGAQRASSHPIENPLIPTFPGSRSSCLTPVAASSKALHARRSSGDASPADCEAAASRSSSFFSKPLQRQTQGREIIEHATTRNLGFLLHLSGVRFAKMGPSKGRGPLIAKFAPVGFKKGFGAVGLGRHTKKGFFLINSMLIPKLHVPENVGSELKPYVSPETFKIATQKFWDDDSNSLP